MDRWRAAGALLALAACIASSAAAPTASNQTALDLYEGAAEGCYYNFQHYGEGDRIMTNEPCLNCTCHNRMLMCYLRVCPFTKAIGQDCTVEKRADQCCPIVTCPDVPVDLLTSTSTTSPAEYGATGLGKLDKYGCSINGKYFPEGSKVPPTPNKPCEHCYCIRNMTTCVMQECTLHVDGCTPIYHKDVCCPVRYSCDHPEDELPLLDDMSTTVRPTPGFLLTTTTVAPVTQMTQDCVHEDQIFADGALIKTEKACEHCYCMKGDIVCVVQECGAPMENEGKNCSSLPPREGQCCPDTYICEGDELTSDIPTESTTESIIEKLTTLSPPRRAGVEGSGYRNEPDETPYTEMPTESEVEGSGEEQETSNTLGPDEIPESEDGEQYLYVSTKAPISEKHDQTTEIDQNVFPDLEEKTDKPQRYTTTSTAPPKEEIGIPEEEMLEVHEYVSTTHAPESYERVTTELGEAQNTVPDVIPDEELTKPHEYLPSTTNAPLEEESGSPIKDTEKLKPFSPENEQDITISDHSETSMHEHTTSMSISLNEIEKEVSTSAEIETTSATSIRESESPASQESEKENEISKSEQFAPSTISYPLDENEKLTTEPDHAENTVAVAEEDTPHPHLHIPMTTIAYPSVEEERTTVSSPKENIVTEEVIKDDIFEPHVNLPTEAPTLEENELTTTKPDREISTIPSEIDEKSSSESSLPQITTLFEETKATESSAITGDMQTHHVEIKPTTISETATRLPENIITKVDQYTITTEPSFRKEDESSVSTEKPKEFVPSTDRSEFVDEGLIPTSDHGEKTSSDVPSTEEEYTTSVPEYMTTQSILETSVVTENLPTKVPERSSEQYGEVSISPEKTADVTASVGENVETTEEPSRIPGEGDCLLNGVTYRNNSVVPSTNNCHSGCRCASSIIKCDPIICSPPPDYMDNCQSIYDSPDSCCPTYVCDHPRETVPPQSDNQMSGTESPMPTPTIECRGDQCEISEPAKQPSEVCSSGTCLPEDDNKPHIECGPDGCSELAQKPEPSQPSVEKDEECIDGKCKPESCANGDCQLPQTDIQVSPVKPCEGKHCETVNEVTHPSSPQLCKNEEDCKSLDIPIVQATPCEGESCKKIDCGNGGCISDVVPHDSEAVQCKDEDGCKTQNIPVPDCTGDEPCRRKEITANDEKLPTECEGAKCKPESDTTDVHNVDTLSTILPTPFEEATEKAVVPTSEEKVTELPESQITTEDNVEEIPAKDTKETDRYTTESQINVAITEADKEKPSIVEDRPTKEPTIHGEESTDTPIINDKHEEVQPNVESESTYKPTAIETDITESSAIIDQGTDKPAVLVDEGEKEPIDVEDKTTEEPSVVEISTEGPVLVDDKDKEKPTISENESTEMPAAIQKEGTELPTITGESTEKPVSIDEESKEKPTLEVEKDKNKPVDEETKEKPELVVEKDIKEPAIEGTKEPVIVEEDGTTKLSIFDGETTDRPSITEKESTKAPATAEEKETDKPTLVDEEGKKKPIDIGEQETEKPDVEEGTEIASIDSDEGKDKPTLTDEKDMETDKLPAGEGLTGEPVIEITTEKLIEKEGTEKPAVISEEGDEEPSVIDDNATKKPYISEQDGTTKPIDMNDIDEERLTGGEVGTTEEPVAIEDKEKEKPLIDEDHKEQPTVIGEDGIEIPVSSEVEKDKPVADNEATEKPITEEDNKKTPALVDQEITEHPILIDEEKPIQEENPEITTVTIEEGSVRPDLVDEEKSSESPSILTEEGTEEPIIIEENDTEKPTMVGEDGKKELAAEKEGTKKPIIVGEDITNKPIIIDEEVKEKPAVIDEEDNIIEEDKVKRPVVTEEEEKTKPSMPEEGITDEPAIIEEGSTEEPVDIEKEEVMKPIPVEREGTELPAVSEEDTEKPSLIDETVHEKPTKIDEEGVKKPDVIGEEDSKKPVPIETGSTDQPTIDDEKYTKEPAFIEKESTDIPTTVKEADIEKPLIDEEGKVRPSIEEDKMDKPVSDVEEGTDKPMLIEEEGKDKLAVIDEEIKDKPTVIKVQGTEKPEEEGSGTLIPETQTDKPEKEMKEPEMIAQTTETTVSELEKMTKTPVYDSQTTSAKDIEYAYSTELNTAEPVETSTSPQEMSPSEIPDIKVPVILEHSGSPEIITGSVIEPEITTKIPLFTTISGQAVTSIPEKEKEIVTVSSISDLDIQTPGSTVDTTDMKEAGETIGQDIEEEMHSTKTPDLHEIIEPIEKTTETGQVSEQEEVFTGTSHFDTPTTKAPGLIEPTEDIKPEKPVLPITGETEEESTTKLYEPEQIKPIPESHVTEVTSDTPEKSDISGTEVPAIKDKDKLEPESQITTQLPEEEIKTDHFEIHSQDKESITTEIPANAVTEPVRRFTEIEDPSVTGQEDIVTGYPEKSTDNHVPSATEKIDETLDITTARSEQPVFTDMESPKLPEETSGFDKPSMAAEDDKEKPESLESHATETPISMVTESQDISQTSEKDVTSYEEKSTSIPGISEEYTEKQETGTEIPQYHVTVSQEHSEATQSYTSEQHATDTQETSTKLEEKEDTQIITTDIPRTSIKEEESETKAPGSMYTDPHVIDESKPSVTEIQKQSTEPPTLEDVQTETPDLYATSEVPQSLVTGYQESTVAKEELTPKPELITTQSEDITKATELHIPEQEELQTETPIHATDSVELSTKATKPDISEQGVKITKIPEDEVTEKLTTLRETPAVIQEITELPESDTKVPELTTVKQIEEGMKSTEYGSPQAEFSETTPYLIELEEHTHKIVEDISTVAPSEEEHTFKPVEDISTSSPSAEEHTYKIEEYPSTISPFEEKHTTVHPEAGQEPQISEVTTKATDEEIVTTTKKAEATSKPSEEPLPVEVPEKSSETLPVEGITQAAVHDVDNKHTIDDKEYTTSTPIQITEESTPTIVTDSEKLPISESSDVAVSTEKETSSSEKPLDSIPHEITAPEDEIIAATTKTTTVRQEEEMLKPVSDDKLAKPDEIPTKTSEVPTSSTTTEISKPSVSDMQPTEEIPAPEEEGHFPPSGTSGYGEPEPDYVEEDQAFGPGTCRYGGKVYVSAQQIPRDDPCDFCFCFRSDIICLQQSCPPPIHGCHEEPIQGFCCPRYECPVSMATTVNVTTTTTTTTTTLPPHFPTHSYKGAAQRRGCQIKGHTYKVGEFVRSSSGPCLHCTCGGDGQMKCDPKACTPEPMLRQMIAAAVSAKRRR